MKAKYTKTTKKTGTFGKYGSGSYKG